MLQQIENTQTYGDVEVTVDTARYANDMQLFIIISKNGHARRAHVASLPVAIAAPTFWVADTFEIMECQDIETEWETIDLEAVAKAAMLTKKIEQDDDSAEAADSMLPEGCEY